MSENSVSEYVANKSPIRFGEKKKNAMAVENFGQYGMIMMGISDEEFRSGMSDEARSKFDQLSKHEQNQLFQSYSLEIKRSMELWMAKNIKNLTEFAMSQSGVEEELVGCVSPDYKDIEVIETFGEECERR